MLFKYNKKITDEFSVSSMIYHFKYILIVSGKKESLTNRLETVFAFREHVF